MRIPIARRMATTLSLSVVVCASWIILWCAPALAHAGIVERQPDDGASVSRPPEQVRLTFNEPVEASFDPLKVFGPDGERVDRENARTLPGEPEVIVTDLEDLPRGSHEVEYRVTSVDGHVVSGDYTFTVAGGGGNGGGDSGGGQREQPAGEEASGSTTTSYSVLSLGGLALIVLGALGIRTLRQRKP